MATETKHFTTNDGVQLAYETAGSSGPAIVFIHGWSGSRKYFQRNITDLAAKCRVCSRYKCCNVACSSGSSNAL